MKHIINELKVLINTRGVVRKSYLDDYHIWEKIYAFEKYMYEDYNSETNKTKRYKELERYKNIFIGFISCLLKYDWERSKREIDGNIHTLFVVLSLLTSFALYTFRYYCDSVNYEKNIDYISYCAIFYLISCLTVLVIILSKYKNKDLFFLYLVIIMVWFLCSVSTNQIANLDCINQIIFGVPSVILICVVFIRIHDVQENDDEYIKTVKFFLKHFREAQNATSKSNHAPDRTDRIGLINTIGRLCGLFGRLR